MVVAHVVAGGIVGAVAAVPRVVVGAAAGVAAPAAVMATPVVGAASVVGAVARGPRVMAAMVVARVVSDGVVLAVTRLSCACDAERAARRLGPLLG